MKYLELLLVAVLVLLVLLSSTLRSIDVEQVLLSLLGLSQPLPNLLSFALHLHIMLVRITTGVSPVVSPVVAPAASPAASPVASPVVLPVDLYVPHRCDACGTNTPGAGVRPGGTSETGGIATTDDIAVWKEGGQFLSHEFDVTLPHFQAQQANSNT